MQNSVLTLGEKIVLASRLAAIEHVRQEIEAARAASQRATATGGARSDVRSASGIMDDSDAETLTRPVDVILKDVFRRIEAADPTVKPTAKASAKPVTAGKIGTAKRRRGAA